MVDYKFKTSENLLFYILNAHIHDWIHDFNNYGRMKKIQKYIGELCIYIERKSGKAGGGRTTRFKGGILKDEEVFEDEYNDIDDKLDDSEIEFDKVIHAFTDGNKIKTGKHKVYIDNEIVEDLKITLTDMTELYDFLKIKPATRSNLHTIQITLDYINELKLCIMGYLESIQFKKNRELGGGGGENFLIDIIQDENIINAINTFENNGKIYVKEEYEKAKNDSDYIMNEINIDNVLMFTKCFKICYQNIRNILNTFDTTNKECIKLKNEHSLNIFNSRFFEECLCFFIYSQDKIKDFNDEEITTISKFVINYVLEKKYNDTKLMLNQNKVPVQESTLQIKSKTPYNIPPDILAGFNRPLRNNIPTQYIGRNMGRNSIVTAVGGTPKQDKKYNELLQLNIEYINLMNDLNGMYNTLLQKYNEIDTQTKIGEINTIKTTIDSNKLLFNTNDEIIKNSNKNDLINNFKKLDTLSKRAREPAKIAIIESIIKSLDTIFTTWNNVKDSATREDTGSSSLKLSGEERMSVQQISKIIAINALRLCCNEYIIDRDDTDSGGVFSLNYTNSIGDRDLLEQIQIIMQVANGGSFGAVDEILIDYILKTYVPGSVKNILTKNSAIEKLKTLISGNPDNNIRAINNAIDRDFNEKIPPKGINTQKFVICPTSSVCDGMKAFGNCYGKQLVPAKKEYNNMEYNIASDGTYGYYTGRSTIKGNKVNIFYDVRYQDLELTNSFILDIKSAPIDLEANVAFRSVIAEIIKIWSRTEVILNEELLWSTLENKDIFLQVLKAGSKKAIGDIFQEINSTLENGGYTTKVTGLDSKLTLGLMGDRPSGARVIKLLKDAKSGINPNAVGGYVAPKKSFIYVPTRMIGGGKKQSKKRRKHKRRTNHKKTKKRKTLKKRKPKRFSRSKK